MTCLFVIVLSADKAYGIEFAAGRVTLNSPVYGGTLEWTSVSFRQTYSSVPLVFVMPTNQAASESSVRIRSVTTSGFQIAHVFPDGSANGFPNLSVDYIAILPGTHSIGGRAVLAASPKNTVLRKPTAYGSKTP